MDLKEAAFKAWHLDPIRDRRHKSIDKVEAMGAKKIIMYSTITLKLEN